MKKTFFLILYFLFWPLPNALTAEWVFNALLNDHSCDLSSFIHSYCGTGASNTPEHMLEDTGYWTHAVQENHWIIIDLKTNYVVSALRARAEMARDPDDVDIYFATEAQGSAFAGGDYTEVVSNWNFASQDPADYAATSGNHYRSITPAAVRYIKVFIDSTENATDYLYWGNSSTANWAGGTPHPAFDVYGTIASSVFSKVFNPTTATATADWTCGGTCSSPYLEELYYLSGPTSYMYENAATNQEIRYEWDVEAQTPLNILGVRMWWYGKEYGSPVGRRSWPRYYDFGASTRYGEYADLSFQFNDTWSYYYMEWLTNPADDAAWDISDFSDWRGQLTSLGDTMPGGQIAEFFLQVIAAPDFTVGAYCNIAPWAGGETDDELIVKCRTSGAAKVRFAYCKTQGPLLLTIDPDSPETGVTVEAGPGSDNAVAANDYVYTKRVTGLDADTTYYFTVFVDGYPSHRVERANIDDGTATSTPAAPATEDTLTDSAGGFTADQYNNYLLVICSGAAEGNVYTITDTTTTTLICSGEDLEADGVESGDSYCIAGPETMWLPLNHWTTVCTEQTACPHKNIYIGDMHSYVRDDELFQSAAAEGASGVILLGDNHSENSQTFERSFDGSTGVAEGYRRLVFSYAVPARHFSYEILKDHTIRAAIPSDHDWGGNNVDKMGLCSTNIFSGGGYDDDNYIPAQISFDDSPATIVVNPDSAGDDVQIFEDNILIRVTGDTNYGTYQADVSSIVSGTYTFTVTPAPIAVDTDATCKLEFIKGRTWKAREAYNIYMPNRIDPDGDGLGDEITIGGTRHLPLPAVDITGTASGGSTTTLVDTDMNPVMFSVDNVSGTFTEGESVTWDAAAGTGTLIYWDSANGVMVIYWTALATLADNDTITNGTATASVNDVTNNGRNWPTVGTFGIYPGRIVYHLPDSTTDYSINAVKSVSGQTITLTNTTFAGESFANGDAYRIQIATLNQRRYHGKDMYITLDVRNLRDAAIAEASNAGGDWLDGTGDALGQTGTLSAKIDAAADGASTDTDTIHCISCTFSSDDDDFGRKIAVGDLVLVDTDNDDVWTDEFENYALVESYSDSTKLIELSNAITGLSQNDGFLVYESGGSDHGSRISNINAGHVMREWFVDALSRVSEGGSRPSWVKWVNVICEQPFHDFTADVGSYDKPGDLDPLDALYNYVKSKVTIFMTTWTGADRHYAGLYDALDSTNPFPSMNSSPAFSDVASSEAFQNHQPGTEWTIETSPSVYRFAGWGLDDAKTDGYFTVNQSHNLGCYGVQEITGTSVTATLYKPNGDILNNDHYADGETGARTISAVADDTPDSEYSRITINPSPGWDVDILAGKIIRILTCVDNEDTVYNEYVIYHNGTATLDIKVADLKATTGLDADDTFEIRDKMWLGIEAYTDNRSAGDLTMIVTADTYFFPSSYYYRTLLQGGGY